MRPPKHSSRLSAGRLWKRYFWTWCAGARSGLARKPTNRRHAKYYERRSYIAAGRRAHPVGAHRVERLDPAHQVTGAALHLSLAKLWRAVGGAHLLAVPPDADLGLSPEISIGHHQT